MTSPNSTPEEEIVPFSFIATLYTYGLFVEAPKGGLILGPAHSEGGIKAVRESSPDKYVCFCEVEGWEFLMNPYATAKYQERITQINNEFKDQIEYFEEYDIDPDIHTLDVRKVKINGETISKVLFFGKYSQYVVNKASTKKYLLELQSMNLEFLHLFTS
jgi:hypothetical protein